MLSVDPHSTDDGTIVLEVAGELDGSTKHVLRKALEGALGRARRAVVVDLCSVTFMDSTGLALMLNAARRLTRQRMGFAIVVDDGPVKRAFQIAGLEPCFRFASCVEDGVRDAQPAFSGWPVA